MAVCRREVPLPREALLDTRDLLSNGHLLSLTQQIARIADQRFATLQPLRDLNLIAHILTNIDRNKMHAAIS